MREAASLRATISGKSGHISLTFDEFYEEFYFAHYITTILLIILACNIIINNRIFLRVI